MHRVGFEGGGDQFVPIITSAHTLHGMHCAGDRWNGLVQTDMWKQDCYVKTLVVESVLADTSMLVAIMLEHQRLLVRANCVAGMRFW